MLTRRCSGVLLHPSSLPGPEGIGTLGNDAIRFIDTLEVMGASIWQMLPLTHSALGNSPYSAFSAFAGNPLLVDLELIASDGDIKRSEIKKISGNRVDYEELKRHKLPLLKNAATAFFAGPDPSRIESFSRFCSNSKWLRDYALFMSLKERYEGKSWIEWPEEAALPDNETYDRFYSELCAEIDVHCYIQWQFHRQWEKVRLYANSKGIMLIGDIPIFVAHDSADVWRNRDIFFLDEKGAPTSVAGVPPDYFSSTGQLWGNPLYDWSRMEKKDNFGWWRERFKHTSELFDGVRIDHFRGFEAAWHVPVGDLTAERGKWVKGPGRVFFEAMADSLEKVAVIAEDLGAVTPEVKELLDSCGFPGMKVLQFAFDSDAGNPYLPHNHIKNCVVYPGTHDNNTTLGWYENIPEELRNRALEYLGCQKNDIPDVILRIVFMSVADTVVIPFQDILRLSSDARMNTPGNPEGNWEWRFSWDMVTADRISEIGRMVATYGRRLND